MTRFWQRWLTLWCIGVGLFGLVLFGLGFPALSAPATAIFAMFGNPFPAEPDRYLRFTASLMGAVTFGWSITFYAALRAVWALDGAAAAGVWRILTGGLLVWYVVDSYVSVTNGFALNAVSNTFVLVGYLIPVVASRPTAKMLMQRAI